MNTWKYIYSLSLCLLAFCFTGCTQELIDTPANGNANEGEPVELIFSTRIPDIATFETKALGEVNEERSLIPLWLIVFNKSGYLTQYKQATYVGATGSGVEREYKFKIELNQTTEFRAIHFISTEQSIGTLNYGQEANLIGDLMTTSQKDAYWQRVEFEYGIQDNAETKGLMTKVPLVRNFAKITVEENLPNFVLEGFTVINTPNIGSMAPYISGGKFAKYVTTGGACMDFNDIIAQDYSGWIPSGMTLENTVNSVGTAFDRGTNAFYLYERAVASSNPTFVLIKGKYDGGTSSYYRIDIGQADAQGIFEYYPLLRNFQYKINITGVVGTGYDTASKAANNVAFNNISASTETQNLLNISDGVNRLYVNFTNKVIVTEEPFELKYMYSRNVAGTAIDNSLVQTDLVTVQGDVINSWGAVTGSNNTGWKSIMLTPQALPANGVKEQTIKVYVANGLSRTINLILRKPWNINVPTRSASGVGTAIGELVTITFNIPNDLNPAIFPLEFLMESDRRDIQNDPANVDAMVVGYGPSNIPGNNINAFYFIKRLEYDAYLALNNVGDQKAVPCGFRITRTGTTGAETTVYITNPYFVQATTTFTR
ncbi:hypothetical protein M2137_002139 [Parabacteroides sp. PFB2-10]|uniref:hypothetical protein n=1 Tax=Parabacteroides sp. PFB2-10 TaxID=1742405 RepID=UPI0024749699|nr:hypothetical protein [Parabacteroides sp. PFB2-10]MDH6313349.1 hypothetical protein [Parabacteroides sp. PFB2-10]MDL2244595.1 hypothetical protein [Parabacteroides sp. OttesenSCG-928-J18]